MKKLESSYIADQNVKKGAAALAVAQNIKYRVTIRPRNSTPRYIPKRNKNICFHKNLYMNNHGSIICNREKSKNPNIHQVKNG